MRIIIHKHEKNIYFYLHIFASLLLFRDYFFIICIFSTIYFVIVVYLLVFWGTLIILYISPTLRDLEVRLSVEREGNILLSVVAFSGDRPNLYTSTNHSSGGHISKAKKHRGTVRTLCIRVHLHTRVRLIKLLNNLRQHWLLNMSFPLFFPTKTPQQDLASLEATIWIIWFTFLRWPQLHGNQ